MRTLQDSPKCKRPFRRHLGLVGLAIWLTAIVAAPAQGQLTSNGSADWSTLIAEEGEWAAVLAGKAVPNSLAGMKLENLTKRDWKQLKREQLEAVRSSDADVWQAAAVNIMYLVTFYGEKVDFDRASNPLMQKYVFDRNEKHRILALAGMHAIGHRDTIARLSQRVRLEASPRVRRLTVAAVQDYFDDRRAHSVTVDEPSPIAGKK